MESPFNYFIISIKLFIFEHLYIKEYILDRVFSFVSRLPIVSLYILAHLYENSLTFILGVSLILSLKY